MKTISGRSQGLQIQMFFPKNQLEQFLYHLQKMDKEEMYYALGPELAARGSKIELVLLELLGFIDFEREEYKTKYLILKRGTCYTGDGKNAGKQGYHLLSGNPESKNTFSFLIHHAHGEILDLDRCWDMYKEDERKAGKE